MVALFERFVRRTVEALKDDCSLWCTVNEPNGYAGLGYITGSMPPGGGGLALATRVLANMARAHAAAYRLIHEIQPAGPCRLRLALPPHAASPQLVPSGCPHGPPASSRAFNLAFPSAVSTGVMRTPLGRVSMPEVRGTQDYFGLNYYTTETAWFDLSAPASSSPAAATPRVRTSAQPASSPTSRRAYTMPSTGRCACIPELPILITENGVESSDDAIRPRYIAQHLHQVWRAVNFNWPVKGYFHWSLVDNFEWDRGWTQRFGLWALDTETQERTKRPSADLYAAICQSNSLSSHMVRQYCPEVFDKIFPPFEGLDE